MLNIPGLSLSKRKHNEITTKTQSQDEILPVCDKKEEQLIDTRLTSANWMAFKEDKFINKIVKNLIKKISTFF